MDANNISRVPDIAQLAQYDVNRTNQYEGIGSSLYDYTSYAAAGQTELSFFQTPSGSGTKTLSDTNMELAGSLPSPKQFLVTSLEVKFWPGVDVAAFGAQDAADYLNDVAAVAKSGYLELFVGSKNYIQEGPIGDFPSMNGLVVQAALTDVTTAAAASQSRIAYGNFGGKPYVLASPIRLMPTQNFKVSLKWPTAVALPSGAIGRIGVKLRGFLYRLSQ